MKTLATALVFMCALTLVCTPALAQITITAANVNAQLAVGKILAYKIDQHTSALNIGQVGSTSWDFSPLRNDSSLTLTSVTVSGTPFTGQFSLATHALQTSFTFNYQGLLIPVTAYAYFRWSADSVQNFGEGVTGTVFSNPASALITNTPPDVYYKLPMTLGTTWTSTYFDTMVITTLFGQAAGPGVRHFTSYVADAYGPMTIPGGTVHDALRMRKIDSVVTYSSGTLTIARRVGYLFLAADGASVQVTASDPSLPDNGSISIDSTATQWNGQVIALPIQLVSFNASQNSPGRGVILRWSTLSEVNNYGFDVQRGARSDGDFVTVSGALIPGHGTTTAPQDYSYADVSAPAGTWYYRLKQIDLDGAVHYTDPARVQVASGGTGQDVPAVFSLAQNFPNPFNPETTIRYGLPSRSYVLLAVYNTLGERVAVIAEGEQESGFHEVRFDGSALASGVYYYRLQAAGFVQTKKLSLLK
jgi:hypothetical protein